MKNNIILIIILIICVIISLNILGKTPFAINFNSFKSGVQESTDSIETSITEDHRTFREKVTDWKNGIRFDLPLTDKEKAEKQTEAGEKLLRWYSGKENKQNYDEKTFSPY